MQVKVTADILREARAASTSLAWKANGVIEQAVYEHRTGQAGRVPTVALHVEVQALGDALAEATPKCQPVWAFVSRVSAAPLAETSFRELLGCSRIDSHSARLPNVHRHHNRLPRCVAITVVGVVSAPLASGAFWRGDFR